jgi:hypothetical protein
MVVRKTIAPDIKKMMASLPTLVLFTLVLLSAESPYGRPALTRFCHGLNKDHREPGV